MTLKGQPLENLHLSLSHCHHLCFCCCCAKQERQNRNRCSVNIADARPPGLFLFRRHPSRNRRGFVGFTRVLETPFGVQLPADLRFVKKYYPSLDLGGVVEFYILPRLMALFDVGDTLIRYGEIRIPGSVQTSSFILQARETKHNLQVSSGIGFRF